MFERSVAFALAGAAVALSAVSAMAFDHHGMKAEKGSIVDVAAGNPDFSTLVTAVKAADLAGTLSSAGPFTVFAPTNAAFGKLPGGTIETLLKPESKGTLTSILTYHVVAGNVKAADLVGKIQAEGGNAKLTTVAGGTLTASLDGDTVKLTDAKGGTSTVAATDIAASNGIIHVIDTVVMP